MLQVTVTMHAVHMSNNFIRKLVFSNKSNYLRYPFLSVYLNTSSSSVYDVAIKPAPISHIHSASTKIFLGLGPVPICAIEYTSSFTH
jgi:hypothetical protein